MSLLLAKVIEIENLMSANLSADINLSKIVDYIIENNSPLNLLNMLTISCEYGNRNAQTSYLSIISECVFVFEKYVKQISLYQRYYSDESSYYYLEFLLGCTSTIDIQYIEDLEIKEDDLAYNLYMKLLALLPPLAHSS